MIQFEDQTLPLTVDGKYVKNARIRINSMCGQTLCGMIYVDLKNMATFTMSFDENNGSLNLSLVTLNLEINGETHTLEHRKVQI